MKTNRVFSVVVAADQTISDEALAKALDALIEGGLADAGSVLMTGSGNREFAELVTSVDISAPVIQAKPRVLVTVSGGIADYVSDPGVEVEIFDRDNHDPENPADTDLVSAHFADLAAPIDVPYAQS